ncbi:15630_t:CDS:2, partial [Funneliformis caledonium]
TSNEIRRTRKIAINATIHPDLLSCLKRMITLEEIRTGRKGGGNNDDVRGQTSTFVKPDPTRQNKNWVDELIVQKDANREYLSRKQELDKHVLFCGPPGTGKSFFAEDIEKQQKVFKEAKELLKLNEALGETKPIAIIIEEIDSVGTKDLTGVNSSSKVEVDGLLKIFDEINRENLNIIVIGTTNNPEVLNEGLVRPGRLGRRIYVNYPTKEETKKMVDYLQKAITETLAIKVKENDSKIMLDSQIFKEDLRKILQNRVDDRENNAQDKYSKLLREGGLFFYGTTKGSFILPPAGYALWKNIQSVLDKKFAARGVQNVLLPTLIPLDLLEKEKKHIAGFSPECFYIEKI